MAAGGQADAALSLFDALLEVLPDPKPVLVPEPRARFDAWNFQEIVRKSLSELVRAAGLRALELLCVKLQTAVDYSSQDEAEGESEDYSSIWRSAIDYGGGASREITGTLVSAVRDAAHEVISLKLATLTEVVGALEKRRWQIFHRIALHTLRNFADSGPNLVVERLTAPAKFDSPGIRREYSLLLQEYFGRLERADQAKILRWIDAGPDLEVYKLRWAQFTGQPVTNEDARRYKERWQRDRLAVFIHSLPEDWTRRYHQLVVAEGPPDDLAQGRQFTGGAFAPGSPKKSEDLDKMSLSELVAYLKSWQPSEEFLGDKIAGLASQLASAVAANPQRFAAAARQFSALDPTYVRELLFALAEQAKKKVAFDWKEVLQLCQWVAQQPREIPGRKGGLTDRDPDWGWTRSTIARFLSSGFESDSIPFELRNDVWNSIEPLTRDPYPSPAEETEYLKSENADPAFLAINSTRGEILSDVIRYALWVYNKMQAAGKTKEELNDGLAQMPEVRQVLEDHLNPKIDPSLAIRSVYGRWIPWLQLIDRAWVAKTLGAIFPEAEDQRELRDTAWTSYVVHCDAYNEVFDLLKSEYRHQIDQIGKHAYSRSHLGHPDERLAAHLMTIYWRGRLELTDNLLEYFYQKAPDNLRGYALEFLGRSLRDTRGEIPPLVIDRLKALWTLRLKAAQAETARTSYGEELSRFGWWFASKQLDNEWAMSQLAEALRIANKAEPDHLVVEKLSELSVAMPLQSVQCLAMIVHGDKDGWGILGWRESARKILTDALNSKDPTAKDAAIELVHKLGSRGYFEFGELLATSMQ